MPTRWPMTGAVTGAVPVQVILADWNQYGRAAGPCRKVIARKCDALIVFWDGKSRGTLDAVWKAYPAGKTVLMVQVEPAEKQGLVGVFGGCSAAS